MVSNFEVYVKDVSTKFEEFVRKDVR